MKNRYTVVFEKSDKWWAVHAEGLSGALSQGRTLNEAREKIKEAIAMILEANGHSSGVTVQATDVLREEVVVLAGKQRPSGRTRKSRRSPIERLATTGGR
ncbi:MAG: type II toxin-antitoxin system HicB family antitoxin [Chthoniobacterales bacterium]|nr:type II toxin-antitoxin system HicB family antitoxin [Chthoniobacterales bacterium]